MIHGEWALPTDERETQAAKVGTGQSDHIPHLLKVSVRKGDFPPTLSDGPWPVFPAPNTGKALDAAAGGLFANRDGERR
jgi:hypothetical protein